MPRQHLPKLLSVAGILLALWLAGRFLLPIFLPFLLGAGLALLAEPLVSYFSQKLRLPRAAASGIGVSMTFFCLMLVILILGALIVRELGVLAGILPDVGVVAKSGMGVLSRWLQSLTRLAPGSLQDYLRQSIADFFSGGTALLDTAMGFVLGAAKGMLSHVPDGALSLGTGIISGFMISAKLPAIRDRLRQVLPKERLAPVAAGWKRIRAAIGGWLKAQCKLAGITLVVLTLGFLVLRISYAPLWAALVTLVDAFPVLGTGTVLVPWGIICLLQGDPGRGVGLLGLYALVSLTRSILEPRLLGRHLGLDPLVTLFSLYAGYKIWGLAGMLVAPMVAVILVQILPRPQARS